jgi:hypothetical protein
MLGVYDLGGRLLHICWPRLWHDMAARDCYTLISFSKLSFFFWRFSLLFPGFTPSLVVFVMAIACT